MPARRRPRPTCKDCLTQDRKRFYPHPTTPSGCQARCKECDNASRVERAASKQPPVKVTVIAGVEGTALYVNDRRVAGPKPWAGGVVRNEWQVSGLEIRRAIRSSLPNESSRSSSASSRKEIGVARFREKIVGDPK